MALISRSRFRHSAWYRSFVFSRRLCFKDASSFTSISVTRLSSFKTPSLSKFYRFACSVTRVVRAIVSDTLSFSIWSSDHRSEFCSVCLIESFCYPLFSSSQSISAFIDRIFSLNRPVYSDCTHACSVDPFPSIFLRLSSNSLSIFLRLSSSSSFFRLRHCALSPSHLSFISCFRRSNSSHSACVSTSDSFLASRLSRFLISINSSSPH